MPKVTQAHMAARRQQIIDAATRVFAERGFAQTSMADVVTASGLSVGGVYRYFRSKSELVLAVVAGRDGTVDGELIPESAGELVKRLATYVDPTTDEGMAHARLVTQIWGDAAVARDIAAVARSTHERLQDHLAGLVRGGDHDPSCAPAVAQVALAALIGLSALAACDIAVDAHSFIDVVIRLVDRDSEV